MRYFLISIIGIVVGLIVIFTTAYIIYNKRDSPLFYFYFISIIGSVIWVLYNRRQAKGKPIEEVKSSQEINILDLKKLNTLDNSMTKNLNMSLLKRTYKKLRQFYNSESDSPYRIAMTFSFAITMISFTLIWLIDTFLLGGKFLSLYHQLFGEFNFRVLIIPTIILIVIFSYQFRKYEADK